MGVTVQWFQSEETNFFDTGIQTLVPLYDKVSILEVNILKSRSILDVSVPINLSIKLDFLSVNVPMETYFVDKLRTH